MITRSFLVGGEGLPAVVIVGLEGKHRWRQDAMPTLKKAVQHFLGHKTGWDRLFVWSHDHCDGNTEKEIEYFEHERARRKYHVIILNADHTFEILLPTTGD